jgi:5-methylthioadenosine/S-adenosylhomocysteine deaminase
MAPDRDPWSTLAYAARGSDVRLTMVDGEVLVDHFALTQLDSSVVCSDARTAAADLRARSGV